MYATLHMHTVNSSRNIRHFTTSHFVCQTISPLRLDSEIYWSTAVALRHVHVHTPLPCLLPYYVCHLHVQCRFECQYVCALPIVYTLFAFPFLYNSFDSIFRLWYVVCSLYVVFWYQLKDMPVEIQTEVYKCINITV